MNSATRFAATWMVCACFLAMANSALGRTSYTTECYGCHSKNATLSSTPANGGTLPFGNVLVGSSKTAAWSATNVGTSSESGMKGDFPAGSGEFTPAATKALTTANGGWLRRNLTGTQTYTYAPTARGTDTLSRTLTVDIGSINSSATVTFSGKGVAPVASKNDAGLAAGLVRLGTSKSLTLQISNTGDGNLAGTGLGNLAGTVPASSGVFTGTGGSLSLVDSGSKSFDFSFTPASRTPESKAITLSFSNGKPDGTNLANTMAAQLSGTGVGPTAQSGGDIAGVINFGTMPVGFDLIKALTIRNASADTGSASALTDLTLISRSIEGAGASFVSTPGFLAGQVLAEQQGMLLNVNVQPALLGAFTATLILATDQGVAKGAAGTPMTFAITGTAAVAGDANLDGAVNATDFGRIDLAYLTNMPSPGWADGDFDRNSVIDGDDFFMIDRGFTGGVPLQSAAPASVPEPSSALLCLVGALLALRRRGS